jgi:predicted alpha/beta-fold hydrolase
MRLAGYSLGGNFALRLALRAPEAGLALAHVAAVCPLLDPATTMDRIQNGMPFYDWYFTRKWRSSLVRKRDLFPQRHDFDDATLALDIRALTDWLVQRHTGFGTLEAYFDGYSIAGDRLAGLQVPAHILMAEDDPVIPFDTFRDWVLPPQATLEIAPWGGHCAFIENAACDGYAERWVADRLTAGAA